MKLSELDTDETTCLMGLLREVVQADGEYSVEEQALMDEIRAALGPARFDAAIAAAKDRYRSRAALQEHAQTLTRAEAKTLIVDTLVRIAAVDGVAEDETRPLRWLMRTWGLERTSLS
ncbi:MAG: TerB family tellurite resistance protein [Myxococcales bacterium]|nr:TerB family tellurite resistance protein [Myxococcales bacterium]